MKIQTLYIDWSEFAKEHSGQVTVQKKKGEAEVTFSLNHEECKELIDAMQNTKAIQECFKTTEKHKEN